MMFALIVVITHLVSPGLKERYNQVSRSTLASRKMTIGPTTIFAREHAAFKYLNSLFILMGNQNDVNRFLFHARNTTCYRGRIALILPRV